MVCASSCGNQKFSHPSRHFFVPGPVDRGGIDSQNVIDAFRAAFLTALFLDDCYENFALAIVGTEAMDFSRCPVAERRRSFGSR
jgi:hypothetical protein